MLRDIWNAFDFRSIVFDGSSSEEKEILSGLSLKGLDDVQVIRGAKESYPEYAPLNPLFNVTLKNMKAVRAAYEIGAGRALFIDGCVKFIDNENEIQNAMSEFPDDDIVLLHKSYAADGQKTESLGQWQCYDLNIADSIFYSLSRRVMSLYLEIEESGKLPDYDWIKEITGSYAVNSLCYRY